MNILEAINDERERLGLSWYRIAKQTGIQQRTLQRFARGQHELGHRKLELVLNELGLKIQRKGKSNV